VRFFGCLEKVREAGKPSTPWRRSVTAAVILRASIAE
jgi:hypothetical protein